MHERSALCTSALPNQLPITLNECMRDIMHMHMLKAIEQLSLPCSFVARGLGAPRGLRCLLALRGAASAASSAAGGSSSAPPAVAALAAREAASAPLSVLATGVADSTNAAYISAALRRAILENGVSASAAPQVGSSASSSEVLSLVTATPFGSGLDAAA